MLNDNLFTYEEGPYTVACICVKKSYQVYGKENTKLKMRTSCKIS